MTRIKDAHPEAASAANFQLLPNLPIGSEKYYSRWALSALYGVFPKTARSKSSAQSQKSTLNTAGCGHKQRNKQNNWPRRVSLSSPYSLLGRIWWYSCFYITYIVCEVIHPQDSIPHDKLPCLAGPRLGVLGTNHVTSIIKILSNIR